MRDKSKKKREDSTLLKIPCAMLFVFNKKNSHLKKNKYFNNPNKKKNPSSFFYSFPPHIYFKFIKLWKT